MAKSRERLIQNKEEDAKKKQGGGVGLSKKDGFPAIRRCTLKP